jgi:DNA-binding HxlR family transcriptional regulator
MKIKLKRRSDCPISYALDIFGDKWSLLVIRDLMFKGKRTYGEFLSSEEKIATNILADRLSLLECAGVITRESDPVRKSRILYTLTDKGIDLLPVQIKKDRKKLVKEISARLKE